jgi:hypothetical protein
MMAIENRNLEVGTRLTATYKKQSFVCTVARAEDGKPEFVLEDGRRFKSLSSAGSAVMGGMACNGWRFWSPEGVAKQPWVKEQAAESSEKSAAKQGRILRKAANQKAVPEGHARLFCAACGESHLMDISQGMPSACPNGHAATAEEFFTEKAT